MTLKLRLTTFVVATSAVTLGACHFLATDAKFAGEYAGTYKRDRGDLLELD